ncbi:MAG TPA: cupin domain-containing protein [Polyangiaceae bacterium]|nr:cupin domain-containing protein [Polyangiaceae bacterium]
MNRTPTPAVPGTPFPRAARRARESAMRRVEKPWGHELIWAETDRYVAKMLFVAKGQRLSRQYHRKKDETFFVETGELTLEIGQAPSIQTLELKPGDSFHCPPGTVHRMVGKTDVRVFEVSTPEIDDVVRLEDAYGREGTDAP